MPRAVLLLLLLVLGTGIGLGFLLPGPVARQGSGDWPAEVDGIAQGHVYSGVADVPETFNPFTVNGTTAVRYVIAFTHDALLDTDPVTGGLRGGLAESWQLDADGLAFTCTLRPGVLFADGSKVMPEDVLFTWDVARTEAGLLGAIGDGLRMVKHARLLPGEPVRLRVELHQRHFDALRVVGQGWTVVQRRFFQDRVAALARADGSEVPQPGQPRFGDLLAQVTDSGPGTGPYQLERDASGNATWRRGSDLCLVRNRLSYRRKLRPGTWNFAGIRLQFVDEPTAAFTRLCERKLDWYVAPDVGEVLSTHPELEADYGKVTYDYLNLGFYQVVWNTRRLGPGVRKALGMLFDRQRIAQDVMRGNAVPAVAYFKPGTPFYPRDLAPLPFDPAQARALLREEGFDAEAGRPLRVRVLSPAGNALFRILMASLASAAQTAGVELTVQEVEDLLIVAREGGGDWDGICNLWSHATWVDPYDLFHSQGGKNRMGFADAEVDDLVVEIRAELDAEKRAQLCDRLNRLVHELQPVAFIVHPRACLLFNKHIRNADPGPLGLYPERFWVPREHQRQW